MASTPVISEEIGAKIAELDDRALVGSEKAAFQDDLSGPTLRLMLQSLLPAPTTAGATLAANMNGEKAGQKACGSI
jgi:hypothetical protein